MFLMLKYGSTSQQQGAFCHIKSSQKIRYSISSDKSAKAPNLNGPSLLNSGDNF